jgi:hypothetical protein
MLGCQKAILLSYLDLSLLAFSDESTSYDATPMNGRANQALPHRKRKIWLSQLDPNHCSQIRPWGPSIMSANDQNGVQLRLGGLPPTECEILTSAPRSSVTLLTGFIFSESHIHGSIIRCANHLRAVYRSGSP